MLRFSSRLLSISFLERNFKNKLKKLVQATRIGACTNCIYRLIHVTMQRYSKHEMAHPINQGIKHIGLADGLQFNKQVLNSIPLSVVMDLIFPLKTTLFGW